MKTNRLNDLDGKAWLKFQKSWFIHNPPPRDKRKVTHPASFPEALVAEFVNFFTKRGQWVLDPFLGTGSTLVACLQAGRNAVGVELSPRYAEIAQARIDEERQQLSLFANGTEQKVIVGDSARLSNIEIPPIDYSISSPPYWDMLRRKGFETQRKRAENGLDVYYSDDPKDLGNIEDYGEFVDAVTEVYARVHDKMRPGAYITIIVKNVKKGGRMYPLAWDIARNLDGMFELRDEKIWCQDNQTLAPYGMGNAWVSNTFHHYCLNLRKPKA